jgi:Zn-dependent protease
MFRLPALAELLLSLPAVLWAITFHEFCHGFMAYKLGDPTAARSGRLSMNPLHHLDPLGALMLLLFRFGWAKPVPIDPRYFKRPKRDMFLVSIAGVTGNFLTAIAVGLLVRAFPAQLLTNPALRQVVLLMIVINISFGVFNLIPIPPLDGSRLLYLVLPSSLLNTYFWLERYGFFILMILVATGGIRLIMGPAVNFFLRVLLA